MKLIALCYWAEVLSPIGVLNGLDIPQKNPDFCLMFLQREKDQGEMSSSKLLRLSTLGLLYFVQGAPYGFQASSLPVMLRQEGVTFTQLGLMKMLFLPWVSLVKKTSIENEMKSLFFSC